MTHLVGRGWLLAGLALSLSGCASSTMPWHEILSAAVSQKLGFDEDASLTAKLNPDYRYLRVQAQGQAAALMVLGYIDPDPLGEIEVWYSSQREVIYLQNGRILSTAGLETNWRSVRFSAAPPVWSAVPPEGSVYTRWRDEMPGHRYARSSRLQLMPLTAVPNLPLPAAVSPEQAKTYRWFSETTLSPDDPALQTSWFAWGVHRGQSAVVYSQQCLSASYCLQLQLWPVQEKAL